VAALVFCVMLLVLSLAFKMSKPVDNALVSIKHVFEPQTPPSAEPEPELKPEKRPEKNTAKKEPQPEAQKDEKTETKPPEANPEKSPEPVEVEKQPLARSDTRPAVKPESSEKEVNEVKQPEPEAKPETVPENKEPDRTEKPETIIAQAALTAVPDAPEAGEVVRQDGAEPEKAVNLETPPETSPEKEALKEEPTRAEEAVTDPSDSIEEEDLSEPEEKVARGPKPDPAPAPTPGPSETIPDVPDPAVTPSDLQPEPHPEIQLAISPETIASETGNKAADAPLISREDLERMTRSASVSDTDSPASKEESLDISGKLRAIRGKSLSEPETGDKNPGNRLMDDQRMAALMSGKDERPKDSESRRDNGKLLPQGGALPAAKSPEPAKKPALDLKPRADREDNGVTLEPKQYMSVFRQWRAGGSTSGEGKRVPLRVENLRQVYRLFQMKPVAVINKERFLDLQDGSQIFENSLNSYSKTVFLVEDAWSKWGEALKAARIRSDDHVEVRYYMYAFVENAIFARANKAFDWCKQTGLIPADTKPGQVDILGRAYSINRQGGGRFGVFVPIRIDIPAGGSVKIDPAACFPDELDIRALTSSGML
jgi:hypothetical protein